MSGQDVEFGKRRTRTAPPQPRRDDASEAFVTASLAARSAFLKGDSAWEADSEAAAGSAPVDDEADMMRYIGPNWPRYRDLWLMKRGAFAPSRSYAAAAFTSLWLLYRKRYALGLLVMAMQIGCAYAAPRFAIVADLAWATFLGRYGKSIVVRDGFAAIARIRSEAGPDGDARARISGAGGTSLIAPIAGALLLGWLTFAASAGGTEDGAALLSILQALDAAPQLASRRLSP
jgi:hypothetical protein